MSEPLMYYDIFNTSSIKTKFNGNVLEEVVPGYRTLNVFGRELIGTEISSQKIEGRDGVLYIGKTLPSRVITVEYWLKADNSQEFIQKFELLNNYLQGEQVEIIFTDDADYYWIGTVESVDGIESTTNWVVSKFNILCADSFKYSVEIKQLSGVDSITFDYPNLYSILPDEIRLVINEDSDTINFKNTTKAKSIVLNSTFEIGQEIILKPKSQEITLDGLNILNKLDLTSNFEDFYIDCGDVLMSTVSCDITINFRDRRL